MYKLCSDIRSVSRANGKKCISTCSALNLLCSLTVRQDFTMEHTFSFAPPGNSTWPFRIYCKTFWPSNSCLPNPSLKIKTPAAHISTLSVYRSPDIYSYAIYTNVPQKIWEGWKWLCFTVPKSMRVRCVRSLLIIKFEILISLKMISLQFRKYSDANSCIIFIKRRISGALETDRISVSSLDNYSKFTPSMYSCTTYK